MKNAINIFIAVIAILNIEFGTFFVNAFAQTLELEALATESDDEEFEHFEDSLEFENEEFDDIHPDQALTKDSSTSNVIETLKNYRLSYHHELASHFKDFDRVVINRSSLRLKWDHMFANRYFVFFDGKLSYNAAYDYLSYPEDIKDHYRFQNQFREFYLNIVLGKTSLKVGKQIVVWGEADGAVVTDVISPRDFTEYIFTAIEDARIGQNLLLIQHYNALGQFSLVLNPDVRVNQFADTGHEYAFPSISDMPGIIVKEENEPSIFKNVELGLRWKQTFGKSDLSLMVAYLIADNPVYKYNGSNGNNKIFSGEYDEYMMYGLAANRVKGNFLFKGEMALKLGRSFNTDYYFYNKGLITKDQFDIAAGIEYNANNAWILSLELSNQYIDHWRKYIQAVRKNETTLYAVWSKDFMHQTVTGTYTFVYQLQDRDGIHIAELSWDINDKLSCSLKTVFFSIQKKGSLNSFFKEKNRLAFDIKWFF